MGLLTGFGRLYKADERDRIFPRAEPIRTQKMWVNPGALDQGNTSQCVAYSAVKYLEGSPIINRWSKSGYTSITELYKEAQAADEIPGENYEGTTVRGVAKILKRKGYISEYRFTYDVHAVTAHLLNKGPVMMGTEWWDEMFVPDRHGYIQPRGPRAGGHAWLLIGCNLRRANPDGTRGAVRMVNSWGRGWGQNGRAWISISHLDELIQDYGEACVATEILRA